MVEEAAYASARSLSACQRRYGVTGLEHLVERLEPLRHAPDRLRRRFALRGLESCKAALDVLEAGLDVVGHDRILSLRSG